MSASYQTSAKSRGRRDGDSMDQQNSSRSSSQVSSRLSRTTPRILEDAPVSGNSMPDSQTLFWQRNRALDPSQPQGSVVLSPRQSAASVRPGRATPASTPRDDKSPTLTSPIKPTKLVSSSKTPGSARSSGASLGIAVDNTDGGQSSNTVPRQPGRLSRPSSKGSRFSQSTAAQMQSRVSDPSENDGSSQAFHLWEVPSNRTPPEVSSVKIFEVGEKQPSTILDPPPPPETGMQSPKYYPPSITSPILSPPQSPQTEQRPRYEGQPAPYPYSYQPNPNMPGGLYAGTFSSASPELPRPPSVVNKEDHQQILEKVTNVLPDINKLLAHYQETRGQLSAKDMMVRQTELMRAEETAQLRLELDAKREEYDKLIERLVGENYRYKLEVEEKNASIVAHEDAAKEYKTLMEEFEAMKARHDEAISAADAARLAKDDLLAGKIELESINAAKHEQHKLDMEALKLEHMRHLETKEADHHTAASEHKSALSNVQLELANLITKHSTVKKDFEASRSATMALEKKLEGTTKNHEAALAAHVVELQTKANEAAAVQVQHRQQMESHLEPLTSSRQQEIQALQEVHDQKLKDMMLDHESDAARLTDEHTTQVMAIRRELEDQKNAFGKLQAQHKEVGTKHNLLAAAMVSWKRKHEDWQAENDKLSDLMETLGQTANSKPGEIYVAAFGLLAHSIGMISRDYFSKPPDHAPVELGMLLEPNLPGILGSTETAIELRSIMIQHRIFNVLYRRIFHPFVFIPFEGQSVAEINHVLGKMSELICQKSLRREALWRSVTLRAIYTSPEARNMVGITASNILDDIMQQVTELSTPSEKEGLVASLRAVVRSAVELWRQTQVEVDQISATMPDVSKYDSMSNVILWVRPHIVRERTGGTSIANSGQEDISLGGSQVLLQGTALEQDSPLVLRRYAALAH